MLDALDALARRLVVRSPRWRRLAAALVAARHGRRPPSLAHLAFFKEEDALGPVQREEALLLFALVRVLRPRVIVEFGFHRGHSALNFLSALPASGLLASYDVTDSAREIAAGQFGGLPGFRFFQRSQTEFRPADVDGREVDLVLFDGAHELAANQLAFHAVAPSLAACVVLAVHDTGTWSRRAMLPLHERWAADRPERWLDENEFQPWREEREFVNWLREARPDLAQLHLHSTAVVRHGLTLLQPSRRLEVERAPARSTPPSS